MITGVRLPAVVDWSFELRILACPPKLWHRRGPSRPEYVEGLVFGPWVPKNFSQPPLKLACKQVAQCNTGRPNNGLPFFLPIFMAATIRATIPENLLNRFDVSEPLVYTSFIVLALEPVEKLVRLSEGLFFMFMALKTEIKPIMCMEIRNIAIIAHVDHGKTTLTDALLRQTGVAKEGISMDSNALELERGITIYSKNAAIFYPSESSGRPVTKINIVDTPGHADFGSEVERVLRSIDSVLLVVDAQEGPMPQTRFVLKKSLELGLKPIVIINKIDKPAANPHRCEEQVLNLFFELGANDTQANFPVVYAIGREGLAKRKLADTSHDLTPLLETILEHVPSSSSSALDEKPLRLQPFNLGYDNFLGRLAISRIHEGVAKTGSIVFIKKHGGEVRAGKITKIFTFHGLEKTETDRVCAGDIALIAGLPDIDIGETVATDTASAPLPAIAIDEPTIALMFLVNNSPFGGREGSFVTSRQIREYLERELQVNVGLRIDFSSSEYFRVFGRGELHVAILLENMRRAGYEVQVSQPHVIIREEDGMRKEPFEEVIVDVPSAYQGLVIERLGARGFVLGDLAPLAE